MENYTIESAKQFLKDNGYFVDNLWSVNDVKGKFECTDEQAQNVLYSALQNEATTEQIQFAINMHAEFDNLPKKSKYFSISGFWRDTNENFKNRIVKETEDGTEEEDGKIFYYGMTEEDINAEIEAGQATALDFVITSYEETTLENDSELLEEFEEGAQNRFRNNDHRSFEEWKEDKLND